MTMHYSSDKRANDPHCLPTIEVFELPADEAAALGITGGWFYWYCPPGCLPDYSSPFGPYATAQQALDAAREDCDADE